MARLNTPWVAVIGLLFFYLTYEFTIVSFLPLMSEVLPQARATLLAANIAILSVGRAIGAWLAPHLFAWGGASIHLNSLATIGLNFLALGVLIFLRKMDRPALHSQ
jgi:predicted MFS family arabinose efflux permease